jgi:acetyltransferase
LVLKVDSPDITHKSDLGGVVLNLDTPEALRDAASTMVERIGLALPNAKILGFTMQPMIRRQNAFELIVGTTLDPQFGPVLLFGHGGTGVELIRDKTVALPPLNVRLAEEMMRDTRIYRLMEGYRDRPAVDLDALALTLVKVSQLVCDIAQIAEMDINPLLADQWGVLALDSRIRVAPCETEAAARLAIRPYPKELEQLLELPDGNTLMLRPIRPEDEPAYRALFERLSAEDIQLRFMHPMKELSHEMAAWFTQIDYERQMELVLEARNTPSGGELVGSVRIDTEPNGEKAEFAILLRRDMAGKGLGPMLMRRIIEYGRGRGLREIYGEVLRENRTMLRLCEAFGFTIRTDPDDPGVMLVSLAA